MKAWSRGRTLAAGILLILLTNTAALTSVWLNRSGEPESRLALTERELALPYRGYLHKENSGLALRLVWRVASRDAGDALYFGQGGGGTPPWLDAMRMSELGFEVPADLADESARRRYTRQLPREALLVLELAGPAWQQALAQARANVARHEAAAAANADSKEFANRAKSARDALAREENTNSRMFAVDIGRDRATLRAKYPDRGRFMIVKGTVRPQIVSRDKQTLATGHVGALAIDRINVPFALRPVIESLTPQPRRMDLTTEGGPRYAADLAIGQRLEPWLATLTPLSE